MANPLANPLSELQNRAGGGGAKAPDWIWRGAGAAAGIAGGLVARKTLDAVRAKFTRRGDVPLNPGDERMTWKYALVWAPMIGVAAAMGRLLAQRAVAAVWTRTRGRPVAAMPGS